MFLKITVTLLLVCLVTSRPNAPEVDFSPEDVKNALISEGVSDAGADDVTAFLFKDRSDDLTPGELKAEFREFLEKLSMEDKESIKRIISRELEKFFADSDDNRSIFLVG